MARLTASRCSGSPAIPRRSCCCGRPRVVVDGGVELRAEKPPNLVRRMRTIKKRRKEVSRGLGADEKSPREELLAGSDGGGVETIASSLGAAS